MTCFSQDANSRHIWTHTHTHTNLGAVFQYRKEEVFVCLLICFKLGFILLLILISETTLFMGNLTLWPGESQLPCSLALFLGELLNFPEHYFSHYNRQYWHYPPQGYWEGQIGCYLGKRYAMLVTVFVTDLPYSGRAKLPR